METIKITRIVRKAETHQQHHHLEEVFEAVLCEKVVTAVEPPMKEVSRIILFFIKYKQFTLFTNVLLFSFSILLLYDTIIVRFFSIQSTSRLHLFDIF